MSLISVVSMNVDGNEISRAIPGKKVVFLRGEYAEHLLYVVESLLAKDASGYYWELDRKAGVDYKDIGGTAHIVFNDGMIQSKDKSIQAVGTVPNVHVIRYTGVDYCFRSFVLESGLSEYSVVYTDMREYSRVIDDAKWIRLIVMVNDVLGFEFVKLYDGKIKFQPDKTSAVPVDCQKFVYMLMAECYLTPPNTYRRVILLSKIPGLSKDTQLELIRRLSDIQGLSLILTTVEAGFSDIKEGSSMSFLTV